MIPIRCFTCGKLLADIALLYEEGKNKICSNPEYKEEDKQQKISELILSFKLKRYCCNAVLMSSKNIVEDIIPVNRN
jgi:DNA-directed RNA polymerase subunit N (RpoN/RPB10)